MTCIRESLLNYLKTYYLNVLVSYCSDLPVLVFALWYQLGEEGVFWSHRAKQPLQNNAVGVAVLEGFLRILNPNLV